MSHATKLFALLLFFANALIASGVSDAQPAPLPSPSPTPTAAPSPAILVTPAALPSPSPTPTILMLPPNDPPQILWHSISNMNPRSGEVVSVIVLASSNVASVEIRVAGYGFNLPKTSVGRFEGSYKVPHLPFFVNHRFTMRVIARNTLGAPAEIDLQMHVH